MSVFIPAIPPLLEVTGASYWLGAAGAVIGGILLSSGKRLIEPLTPERPNKRVRVIGSSTSVVGSSPGQVIGSRPAFRLPSAPSSTISEDETVTEEKAMGDNTVTIVKDHIKVHDRPKGKKLNGKPFYYSQIGSQGLSSPEGFQAASHILSIGTTEQYFNDLTGTANPTGIQSAYAWYSLNPSDHAGGTAKIAAVTATPDQEICLEYVNVDLEIINLENHPSWLTLNVAVSKCGTAKYMNDLWAESIASEKNGISPAAAKGTGVSLWSTAQRGSADIFFPGTSYSYYKDAHKMWKPLRSYDFCFAAGQIMNVRLSFELNSVHRRNLDVSLTEIFLKDCIQLSTVQRGTVCRDSDTSDFPIASTAFGINYRYRCKFRNIDMGPMDQRMSWVAYATGANNPIASQRFMDTATDAATGVEQA